MATTTVKNNAMWMYVDVTTRKQCGPLTLDQLKDAWKNGIVRDDTLVWCKGLKQWSKVKTLDTLHSELREIQRNKPKEPARKKEKPVLAAVAAKENKENEPEINGWKVKYTVTGDDGLKFYYHEESGQVSWEKPLAMKTEQEKLVDLQEELVWIPHETDGWQAAKKITVLDENYNQGDLLNIVHVRTLSDGTLLKLPTSTKMLPLKESSLTVLVDDLVALDAINEATITHNLKERYKKDQIYTWVGASQSVLVSVNPFKQIPGLYSSEKIEQYRKVGMSNSKIPHVFAIASEALEALLVENQDQSILISGESGAGKTEATKQCLSYLAEACSQLGSSNSPSATTTTTTTTTTIKNNTLVGEDKKKSGGFATEQKVLVANPLLEAFGNAKTVRNNNSSRFGKWIEVHLDPTSGSICGARLSTYLLEKSRVVGQHSNERNYHIFYQLFSNPALCERFCLEGGPQNFAFTKECTEIDDVDDDSNFQVVSRSMDLLNFSEEEKDWIFQVVSGIIHLGQIRFEQKIAPTNIPFGGSSNSNQPQLSAQVLHDCMESLDVAAQLFGITMGELERVLLSRSIEVRGEKSIIPLSSTQAKDGRDALAKSIYGKLFDEIVCLINSAINGTKMNRFIGILDIFGFEIFEQNSFEQFCINYANEKLQQHFNNHTFKEEENLYLEEGIPFVHIPFIDNQSVLDLIEKKPIGLIHVLDEQIKLGGTDENFLKKADGNCRGSQRFRCDLRKKSTVDGTLAFEIDHYAGSVRYNVQGFIMKNKDTLYSDMEQLCASSSDFRVAALYANVAILKNSSSSASNMVASRSLNGPTGFASNSLSNQFRKQLSDLMILLNNTESRFIRCIKPNDLKKSSHFQPPACIAQLKYSGVFEAVQIRKCGYPFRLSHKRFCLRYSCINNTTRNTTNSKKKHPEAAFYQHKISDGPLLSKEIICRNASGKHFVNIQFGKNRVLYRAEEYRSLELLRSIALENVIPVIQKVIRGHLAREYKRRALVVEEKLEHAMTVGHDDLTLLESTIESCFETFGTLRRFFDFQPRNLAKARELKRNLLEWNHVIDDIDHILQSMKEKAADIDQENSEKDHLYETLKYSVVHAQSIKKSNISKHSETSLSTLENAESVLADCARVRLEPLAEEAIYHLDLLKLNKVLEEAKNCHYVSSQIEEVQRLLNLSEIEFSKLHFKKALMLNDPLLKKERERKLQDMFLKANASNFKIQSFRRLREPAEFAATSLNVSTKAFAQAFGTAKKAKAALNKRAQGMLQWSDRPIHTSLIDYSMNGNLEVNNKIMIKDSCRVFKDIMAYMGDRTYAYPTVQAATDVLTKLLACPGLRTEILLQLIKQLTMNPSLDSSNRGWELMGMALSVCPVDSDFETWLLIWIQQHAGIHADKFISAIRNLEDALCARNTAVVDNIGCIPNLCKIDTIAENIASLRKPFTEVAGMRFSLRPMKNNNNAVPRIQRKLFHAKNNENSESEQIETFIGTKRTADRSKNDVISTLSSSFVAENKNEMQPGDDDDNSVKYESDSENRNPELKVNERETKTGGGPILRNPMEAFAKLGRKVLATVIDHNIVPLNDNHHNSSNTKKQNNKKDTQMQILKSQNQIRHHSGGSSSLQRKVLEKSLTNENQTNFQIESNSKLFAATNKRGEGHSFVTSSSDLLNKFDIGIALYDFEPKSEDDEEYENALAVVAGDELEVLNVAKEWALVKKVGEQSSDKQGWIPVTYFKVIKHEVETNNLITQTSSTMMSNSIEETF